MVEVLAPMTSGVYALICEVGDSVVEGDEIMSIEAMKMITSVLSPCEGTVREICVQEGEIVNEGSVLAKIEEED